MGVLLTEPLRASGQKASDSADATSGVVGSTTQRRDRALPARRVQASRRES